MDSRDYRLWSIPELSAGVRLGGKFVGPKLDTSALWVGRPPVLENGIGPTAIAIAAQTDANVNPAQIGQTVTVEAEGANADGGRVLRTFNVGGGMQAVLRLGNYQHVRCRVLGPSENQQGIPANMTVFFSWSFDLVESTPLFSYLDYTVINTIVRLPEGTRYLYPESACVLTWSMPQYSTIVSTSASAGQRVAALWGAVSCNLANKFIVEMHGI